MTIKDDKMTIRSYNLFWRDSIVVKGPESSAIKKLNKKSENVILIHSHNLQSKNGVPFNLFASFTAQSINVVQKM